MTNRLGLYELNTANPNNFMDACRNIDGPNLGLGDLLNAIIATANAGNPAVGASATATYATATAADVLEFTIDGVLYTHIVTDATSVTTAAAEAVAALNADADFSLLYVAENTAGVLTITALQKGTAMNGTTFATDVTGTGTLTAGAATMTGGTGVDDVKLIVD